MAEQGIVVEANGEHPPHIYLDSSQAPYQCVVCNQNYTRLDHLSRHFRAHTREKPFSCIECGKAFARSDLLKRHAAAHVGSSARNKHNSDQQTAKAPVRALRACIACARSKVRCDGAQPCTRCTQRAVECLYKKTPRPTYNSRLTTTDVVMSDHVENEKQYDDSVDASTGSSTLLPLDAVVSDKERPQASHINNYSIQDAATNPVSLNVFDAPLEMVESSNHMLTALSNHDWGESRLTTFLRDIMQPDHGQVDRDHFSSLAQTTHLDLLDFSTDNAIDLDGFDFYGTDPYPQGYTMFQPGPNSANVNGSSSGQGRGHEYQQRNPEAVTGTARERAFKDSLWLYTPGERDFANAAQDDIASSPEIVQIEQMRCTRPGCVAPLNHRTRDRILGMVLGSCQREVSVRIASAFPPTELLTNLMHTYIHSETSKVLTWLHLPSLQPEHTLPELLLSMITAGALLSPLLAVRKLGHALYDVVREAIAQMFERDNRNIRKLECVQAVSIMNDMGLWCGDRRKLEITESFCLATITMLRRGGRFNGRSSCEAVSSTSLASEDDMTTQWRSWVIEESWKRLVLQVMIRDAQMSLSLNVTPIIPSSEMMILLPAHNDIWSADSPVLWYQLFKQTSTYKQSVPSLISCIEDTSLLTAQLRSRIDIDLTIMAILAGFQDRIWHCRKLMSFLQQDSRSPSHHGTVLARSLHAEVAQRTSNQHLFISDVLHLAPVADIMFQRQLIELHASLEDLQTLAGKNGEDNARKVHSVLYAWSRGPDCRKAVYHACQLIRIARLAPTGSLRDASAVACYHAALVLWSYGILSPRPDLGEEESADITQGVLYLDQDQNHRIDRFIAIGRGQPAISSRHAADEPVFLNDPQPVMAAVTALLQDKNAGRDDASLSLVGNLCKLMHSLGHAAHAIKFS